MGKRYNTVKKLINEDPSPYYGERDFKGGWRKKVISESDWIPELLNPVKSTITSSGFDDIKKKLSFRKLVEKESSETVFQVQQPYIKNLKICDDVFDNISNWREELIDEGMSSKDFPDLYGYGISIFDMPITSTIQTPVQSTKAQDIVDASADATDHEFGPQFPGSYRNVVGGVQSLSKVDVQAHITTDHEVTPNQGEMAHPEKHVFTYQSEGNSIKWPTEFTLPDSFNDDLMWYDAEGNPQEWIHYIWPVHGHPGNYTPLDSDDDDTPFWYDPHPHDSPGSAWGHNSETDSDDKLRQRVTFNAGRIDRRSITDTSFDVTYGAARSIDSSAFDLTGNMDSTPWSEGFEADYGLDVNDTAALNALRLQWDKPRTEPGHEDWQYIRSGTSTGYIDQIYGVDFPFAEYDYSPYESDHWQFTGTDGWDRIHPNLNTDASFAKKIIKNVQVGDKISFSYKWYSDTWLYNTENYGDSYITDDYVRDGIRYGDHDWNSSYFRAMIGANNKVVSIKDQWQMIGADPSLTLTDGTYTIPPLPNPTNPEDNELYNEYNITKKDNGFSFPYSGTYEYTVQEGDIDAAGLFQFTTILLAESTNLEYVQVTNFAHTIGDRTRTAAGQLGKTTDAYNLGTSVASLDPNEKYQENKKKKDKEEQERRKIEQEILKKEKQEMDEKIKREEEDEKMEQEVEDENTKIENGEEKEDKKKEEKSKPKQTKRKRNENGQLLPLPGERSDRMGLWLPHGKTESDYHYYQGHRYEKGSLNDTGIPIGYMGKYVGTDRYGRNVDIPYTFVHRPGWAYSELQLTFSSEKMKAKFRAHYDAIKAKYKGRPDSFWRSQPYHLNTPWKIAVSTPFKGARPYVARGEDAPGEESVDQSQQFLDSLPIDLRNSLEDAGVDWSSILKTALDVGNVALDVAAIIGILFPEPGSSAAGLARLLPRLRALKGLLRRRIQRGALNPFGQRTVRSGPAGRKRVDVYSGRPYQGKRGYGKTTYGSTDPQTGATYSHPDLLRGLPGRGGSVSPKGTVDRGTLPQRYIDKYGSRNVYGQQQIKLGPKAARRTFGESVEQDSIGNAISIFIRLLEMMPTDKAYSVIEKIEEYAENSKELYPGQPSPSGFPDTPPPKLAPNGYHPRFGKKADRYRRLDSISAKTMDRVKTGDPETDAQVSAAAKSVFKRFNKYR